jgi:hypothetical protein
MKINKLLPFWMIEPVGGQNSSSNLFLGSEPHVRALAWLGKKGKMTPDLP